MTVRTRIHTAHLIGDPDVELSIIEGNIALDARTVPHVQATLTIASPGTATLAALDPRHGARVLISANDGARTFNLGIRERPKRHRAGTIELVLASDEAAANDYAPLADDDAPYYLSENLWDVCAYVLSHVDAEPELIEPLDVRPFWESRNRVIDPIPADTGALHFGGDATSNASGIEIATDGGWFGGRRVRWTAPSTGLSVVRIHQEESARPGETFTLSAHMRAGSAGATGYMRMVGVNKDRTPLQTFNGSPQPLPSDPGEYERLSLTARFDHPDTVEVLGYMVANATSSGQAFAAGGLLYTEGTLLVPWFYGGLPDDDNYSYSWDGTVNASGSIRTPFMERDPEAFIWPAGVGAIDFLAPILQAVGRRLVCDENRQWTIRTADYLAAGAINIRHGVNLIDATDVITREGADGYYDAAVTEYVWKDRNGVTQRRIDAYASDSAYSRCIKFQKETPYPGPGFSAYAVQRSQGRGRVIDITAVADWSARAEMSCAFVVEDAPTQTGQTDRVVFDLAREEMTATARTTDTPEGSWLLGTPDETWLDAPDEDTWMEAG